MSVKTISKDELRRMEGSEGLILQGCGGNLDEWVDGINDMLTEDGILLNGTRFHDCSTFEHDGSTCLLFPFKDDVELDVGKLAMWRLQTHGNFGGTWLSDYVPNKLGGFISKEQTAEAVQKPDCPLIGQDGNIFNLMGIASRTLKQNGLADQAKKMCDRIRESGDYGKQAIRTAQPSQAEPSIEQRRLDNEIARTLEGYDFDKDALREKLYQRASLGYLQIGDEAYVEHKLKNTLEQHDTLDSFDSELTNKTVKLIKLAENGSVSIILINDQEIRKEQTDHANSNPSDAT